MLRLAAVTAMSCLAWGLPASAQASTVPVIDSESVSNVTSSDATLEAFIDSQEAPAGDYYQFQVVANPGEFASEILCPSTRPQGAEICVGPQSPGVPPIGFHPSSFEHLEKPVRLDLNSAGVTLKPGTTYHYRVLVARRVQTEDTIQWASPTVYGPDQTFTTPPAIEGESVSNITATDAMIEAQINPGGLDTSYEVWVGTVGCIEENLGAVCHSTSPGEVVGTIPAGASTQMISVDVAKAWHKLTPNSSYVFTVSATSSAGKANSNFKIFKTAAGVPPAIEGESVSNITPTDATLEAQINSEGLATSYEFYLQEAPLCFKANPPCERPQHEPLTLAGGKLFGSFVAQSVSADLNSAGVSLSPGEHYEYWVTATSLAGTATGPAQEFSAPEEKAQPLNVTTPSTTNGNSQGTSSAPTVSGGSPAPGVKPLGFPIVCLCNCARGCHGKEVGLKHLTRTQKLSKALKACAKKPKRKRAAC